MTYRNMPTGPHAEALYLDEINQFELLTAEREVELAQQIELGIEAQSRLGAVATGEASPVLAAEMRQMKQAEAAADEAREEFFHANLRFVIRIAKRHPNSSALDFLDLIQEGNVGLRQAVERFDWRRGNKFSTFAFHHIRGAVVRALQDQESPRPLSLNRPVGGEDSTMELGDTLPSELDLPESVIDEVDDQLLVTEALQHVTDRQRQAFELYFGLQTGDPMSYEDVGKELGVSKNAAHTLVENGLKTLRRKAEYGIITDGQG